MERIYRANVRFGTIQAGEHLTIPDDRLAGYESLIDQGWLTEIRTPQGRLADLAAENATQGAGDDGPDGKAGPQEPATAEPSPGEPEPEPAPTDLPSEPAVP